MTAVARSVAVLAALVAFVPACRAGRSTGPEQQQARVANDLRTLCSRIKARSMSGWGQPTMMTDEVQNLTTRIDRGDRAARCELGRLMHELVPDSCPLTAQELMTRCP